MEETIDLDGIEARAKTSSARLTLSEPDRNGWRCVEGLEQYETYPDSNAYEMSGEDAAFIVNARRDVLALVAHVREQEELQAGARLVVCALVARLGGDVMLPNSELVGIHPSTEVETTTSREPDAVRLRLVHP